MWTSIEFTSALFLNIILKTQRKIVIPDSDEVQIDVCFVLDLRRSTFEDRTRILNLSSLSSCCAEVI